MQLRSKFLAIIFFIVNVQGQIWDCPNCDPRGPGNAPGAQYGELADCARNCMIKAPPAKLGCDSVDCICNGGQFPFAISAILSCAQASCSPGPAVATATNVVSSYCQAWSQTALPQLTSILSAPTFSSNIAAANSGPTSTASSSVDSESTVNVKGLIIGLVFGMLFLFAVLLFCCLKIARGGGGGLGGGGGGGGGEHHEFHRPAEPFDYTIQYQPTAPPPRDDYTRSTRVDDSYPIPTGAGPYGIGTDGKTFNYPSS